MLQDTGLGQEMFISTYRKHENGIDKNLCYRYTDDLVDMDMNQDDMIPNQHLSERSSVYCVSPPGETHWVKEYSKSTSDVVETMNNLNLQETSPSSSFTLQQKFPLPGTDHIAAIVKFYDDTDSLRVGQLVDIIGVLGTRTNENLDVTVDEQELFDSHLTQQYKDTTVVHAITYSIVQGNMETPFYTNTQLDDTLVQSQDIRGHLIDYIATCFGDDKLVAEYVLLQLLSKVSSQRHGLKIGQFCLNITNFQPTTTTTTTSTTSNTNIQPIIDMVSNLVLHQVFIPLTLDTLNKSRFSPQSINEDLLSGVLQLVPGTHILVDESELSEGQLGDTGVRNMQALMNAIQHQTLTYGFPYSQFNFDVDLAFITLSTRKSLLPNHCTIVMKPTYPLDQTQPENRSSPKRQQLDVFRMFIQASRHASYEIPEDISQYIQDDFVKERKKAADQQLPLPSQEDLMLRMNLCRLVALSFGQHTLTKDIYDYTVRLDQLRKSRM
ncbi:putative alanine racemase-domain-containing protein [Chlamydoabsidia padenii]|nr:putative alanine racemase-domain-containing protein [Chlamydoabsidia padenii]